MHVVRLTVEPAPGTLSLDRLAAISAALERHTSVAGVWNAQDQDALPLALRQQCNLLLVVGSADLDRGLCCRLQHVCGASVLWLTDASGGPSAWRDIFTGFTRTYFADVAACGRPGDGLAHLPLAACRRHHEFSIPADADEAGHYRYDVLIANAAAPQRVEFLRQFLAATQNLRIKLAMSSDPANLAAFRFPAGVIACRASGRELARLANLSRAVLWLDERDAVSNRDDAPNVTQAINLSRFEAALAGGFPLVDESDRNRWARFETDRELVTFAGLDDCLARLHYYLQSPRERLAITRAAQERAGAKSICTRIASPRYSTTCHAPVWLTRPRRKRLAGYPNHGRRGCCWSATTMLAAALSAAWRSTSIF